VTDESEPSADQSVLVVEDNAELRHVLKEALAMKTAIVKRLDPIQWNEYIVRELGGHLPAESFVVPVIVQGKTALILYGDNAPAGDKIGDTSTLEIFLAQASMALERILLERRLSETKD